MYKTENKSLTTNYLTTRTSLLFSPHLALFLEVAAWILQLSLTPLAITEPTVCYEKECCAVEVRMINDFNIPAFPVLPTCNINASVTCEAC